MYTGLSFLLVAVIFGIQCDKTVTGCFDKSAADICNKRPPRVPFLWKSRDLSSIATDKLLQRMFCDLFAMKQQQWYSSKITMANTCPDNYKCGTIFPIWMKGNQPEQDEGIVNRTACLRGFDNCCLISYRLAAVSCKKYMAYCLLDLPSGCPQRYCFEKQTKVFTPITSNSANVPLQPTTTLQSDSETKARGKLMTGCSNTPIADICSVATPDVPYMSSRNPLHTGMHHLLHWEYCDSFAMKKQHWYKSEITMSTTCPEMYRCGAKFPIWMDGFHPGQNDGIVNRKACLRGFEVCCVISYKLAVVNCGQYMAYCLLDLPSRCPQRYCFGDSTEENQTKVTTTFTSSSAKWSKNVLLPSTTTLQPESETDVPVTKDKQVQISKGGTSTWSKNVSRHSMAAFSPKSNANVPFTNVQVTTAIIVVFVFGLTALAVIVLLKCKRLKVEGRTVTAEKETPASSLQCSVMKNNL